MLRTPSIFTLLPLSLLACGGSPKPSAVDTLLAEEVPTAVTESKSGNFQIDPGTNLYWSNNISVVMEYWETDAYCAALGHEWRLPTLGELRSTFVSTGSSVAIKDGLKRGVPAEGVLFSSEEIPRVDDQKQPWVVQIETGKSVVGHAKEGYARCVHGPKSLEQVAYAMPPAEHMGEQWWESNDACPEGSVARGTPGRLVACTTATGKISGRSTTWTAEGRIDGVYQGIVPDGSVTKWSANGRKISEFFYSEGELHGRSTLWHANGEKSRESTYAHGKLDGRDRSWHGDGLHASDLSYRAGELHGQSTHWHANGEKSSEATFAKGKLNGTALKWSETGLATSNISYRAGELHGLSTYWHANGEKSSEATFASGKLNGTATKWRADGIKESQAAYRNGELHGVSVAWFPNGEKFSESKFANGKLNGTTTIWESNGLKTSEKNYRNGELHGTSTVFFANGEAASSSTYADGKMHGEHKRWNEQGSLLEKTQYANARITEQLHYDSGVLRNGPVESKHPNGVASYVGVFKDGRAQGKHYGYHPNGKYSFERNYNAKGILSGRSVDWHANGKTREGSKYVQGAMHGERVAFNPDGTVKAKMRYKHGIPVSE